MLRSWRCHFCHGTRLQHRHHLQRRRQVFVAAGCTSLALPRRAATFQTAAARFGMRLRKSRTSASVVTRINSLPSSRMTSGRGRGRDQSGRRDEVNLFARLFPLTHQAISSSARGHGSGERRTARDISLPRISQLDIDRRQRNVVPNADEAGPSVRGQSRWRREGSRQSAAALQCRQARLTSCCRRSENRVATAKVGNFARQPRSSIRPG